MGDVSVPVPSGVSILKADHLNVAGDVSVSVPSGVSIPEVARLKLARQLLLSIGVLTLGFFAWYARDPENSALRAIFELFKIGVLPLITLIVTFYFPRTDH